MQNQYEIKIWFKDGVKIDEAVDFIKEIYWEVPEENFILMGQILTIEGNGEDEFNAISWGCLHMAERPSFWKKNFKRWWWFFRDEPWEDSNLIEGYSKRH